MSIAISRPGTAGLDRSWLTGPAEIIARYGLAAFILCIPLEFTSMFLRQQASRFVLVVVAAAFVFLLATGRRVLAVPRAPSAIALAAFVAYSLLSWLVTRAPDSRNPLLDVALYPLVGLLVFNLAAREEDHERAWTVFLVSGLGVAVLGLILYVANVHIWEPNPLLGLRSNVTFADPNITARFYTICACAAILLFATRRAPAWLCISTAIACAFALPITFSRSGLAFFIVSVALAVVVSFQHRRALALGAATLVAFGVFTAADTDTRDRAVDATMTVVNAITGTSHNIGTTSQISQSDVALEDNRKYLVAAGLKMVSDHPITGVGFGGYRHAILTTYKSFLPPHYIDSVSHTSLITVLAEEGLIGALVFLAFLVLLAREAVKAWWRRDSVALWAALPAFSIIPILMYSQFEGRLIEEPYLWLALGLFYAAIALPHRETKIG